MPFSSRRFALLGALATCVALVASFPLLAGAATTSSTVTVAIKAPNEFAFKLSKKSVPTV